MTEVRIEPARIEDEFYFRRHYVESELRKSASGWSWLVLLFATYPVGDFIRGLPHISSFNLIVGIGLLLIAGFLRWQAMTLSRKESEASTLLAQANGVRGSAMMLYKPDYLYIVKDGKPIGRLSGDVLQHGAIQYVRSYVSY